MERLLSQQEAAPKRLLDFVIERETRGDIEFRNLDSVRLQEAIEKADLSEEEILKEISPKRPQTLAERIAKYSIEAKEEPLLQEELDKLQAMRAAREHYVPLRGNQVLALDIVNQDKIIADFMEWFALHEHRIPRGLTDPELGRHLKDEKFNAHIDITFDYPSLSHGIRVDSIGNFVTEKFSIAFYDHGKALENKIRCQTDILSGLKILNHFKAKGHKGYLTLSHENNLRVDYAAV